MEQIVINGISSTTEAVTDVLTGALPIIFVVFGGLIALAVGIKYVRKLIGKK